MESPSVSIHLNDLSVSAEEDSSLGEEFVVYTTQYLDDETRTTDFVVLERSRTVHISYDMLVEQGMISGI